MKKITIYILLLLVGIIGCSSENTESESKLPEGTRKIEVVESLTGGGYTFIKGNESGNEFWIAVREMEVNKGEIYYFTGSMVMSNFESKSLNKTFESILFVDNISNIPPTVTSMDNTGKPGMSSPDGHTKPKVEAKSDINIQPLSDGKSVEAVNNEKANLAGKTVKVKGVVTKYNAGIMNRNWIHIQDGSGTGETADLTITSDQTTKVGDTIIIEGTVTVDKDFGAGYFYNVIVENASIVIEKEL